MTVTTGGNIPEGTKRSSISIFEALMQVNKLNEGT
jgi:hypothetical protein